MVDLYRQVVDDGEAHPCGAATRGVFREGWTRKRQVFVATGDDGRVVGSYFVRANVPALAGHIAQSG